MVSKICVYLLLSNIDRVVDRLRLILKNSFEINNNCLFLVVFSKVYFGVNLGFYVFLVHGQPTDSFAYRARYFFSSQ